MKFAIALLAGLLLVSNLPSMTVPKVLPVSNKGTPKFFDTYGKDNSSAMLGMCIDAGKNMNFEESSLKLYCMCHLYVIQDIISFDDLNKLSKDDLVILFTEAAKGCTELGFYPKKKEKIENKPGVINPKPFGEVPSIDL